MSIFAADETILLDSADIDETVLTTFGQFCADNEFDAEWIAEISASLFSTGSYQGGGGSTPDWAIHATDARWNWHA